MCERYSVFSPKHLIVVQKLWYAQRGCSWTIARNWFLSMCCTPDRNVLPVAKTEQVSRLWQVNVIALAFGRDLAKVRVTSPTFSYFARHFKKIRRMGDFAQMLRLSKKKNSNWCCNNTFVWNLLHQKMSGVLQTVITPSLWSSSWTMIKRPPPPFDNMQCCEYTHTAQPLLKTLSIKVQKREAKTDKTSFYFHEIHKRTNYLWKHWICSLSGRVNVKSRHRNRHWNRIWRLLQNSSVNVAPSIPYTF